MKSCRFDKYICLGLILSIILSGMCFANDKADSISSCAILKECGQNDKAEIYDIANVSNLQLLRNANTASVIRQDKRFAAKRETKQVVGIVWITRLSMYNCGNFAVENNVVHNESVGSSIIVKYIQQQDGKKSQTSMI